MRAPERNISHMPRNAHRTTATAVILICSLLALAGCGGESESAAVPSPSTQELTFTEIDDQTNSDYYKIADSAQGHVDSFGAELTLGFIISHANGTYINPKATIEYADGSTQTCQETDLRRRPSLVKSTTSWDFPCGASLGDPAGAVVTVIDEYN